MYLRILLLNFLKEVRVDFLYIFSLWVCSFIFIIYFSRISYVSVIEVACEMIYTLRFYNLLEEMDVDIRVML